MPLFFQFQIFTPEEEAENDARRLADEMLYYRADAEKDMAIKQLQIFCIRALDGQDIVKQFLDSLPIGIGSHGWLILETLAKSHKKGELLFAKEMHQYTDRGGHVTVRVLDESYHLYQNGTLVGATRAPFYEGGSLLGTFLVAHTTIAMRPACYLCEEEVDRFPHEAPVCMCCATGLGGSVRFGEYEQGVIDSQVDYMVNLAAMNAKFLDEQDKIAWDEAEAEEKVWAAEKAAVAEAEAAASLLML